jgi:hypothetical protein
MYLRIYIYAYLYVCMHIHTYMHVCMYVCTYIPTHMYACIHIYIPAPDFGPQTGCDNPEAPEREKKIRQCQCPSIFTTQSPYVHMYYTKSLCGPQTGSEQVLVYVLTTQSHYVNFRQGAIIRKHLP